MLKIKVSIIYLSAKSEDGYSYSYGRGSLQGMSEAKVEKIKVRNTFAAYMRTLLIRSQEAAHKIIVRLFHPLPFVSRGKSRIRDPRSRRVSSSKKSANESWQSAREAKPSMPF
jgi:hypothetical protein